MSHFHCSCGFAIDDPDEFGDHFRLSFAPGDDIGTDGHAHTELTDEYARATGRYPASAPLPRQVCSCGYATDDTAEFDDHMLMVFITPDGIGDDGEKHVPSDPSTPDRWYTAGGPADQRG